MASDAAIPLVWCEYTGEIAVWLRRYAAAEVCAARGDDMAHDAQVRVEDQLTVRVEDQYGMHIEGVSIEGYRDDPRWPTVCEHCQEYEFQTTDERTCSIEQLLAHPDGESYPLRSLPPGSMYDAWWMPLAWRGPDGIALAVILPDGLPWYVDGMANNCDQRDREHQCWVRHGDPRTEPVHVDKGAPGESCAAGAGSIATPDYHGFAHHGFLTPC